MTLFDLFLEIVLDEETKVKFEKQIEIIRSLRVAFDCLLSDNEIFVDVLEDALSKLHFLLFDLYPCACKFKAHMMQQIPRQRRYWKNGCRASLESDNTVLRKG